MRISDWSSDVCSSDLIVHNKYVVDSLKAKGAVFVEKLDMVPDGVPVVFSAYGVPKAVPATAEARGLFYLDASCPLVFKVHLMAERPVEVGRHHGNIVWTSGRERVCQTV